MSDPFAAALERAKQIAAKLKKAEVKPVEQPQRQMVIKPKDNSLKKYIPVIKTIEIVVPSHMIAFVLGRGGENLEKIQQETNTNIDFNEKTPDDGRLCKVRGEETSVEEARAR
jgi:polyribonucleotide nucleotidyltransferase